MALWLKCSSGRLVNLDMSTDIFVKKYTDDSFEVCVAYSLYNPEAEDIEYTVIQTFKSRKEAQEKVDKIWELFIRNDRADNTYDCT